MHKIGDNFTRSHREQPRRNNHISSSGGLFRYLEDLPQLVSVVQEPWLVIPLRIGWLPFQMAFLWLINGSDPSHLLIGDPILQVGFPHQVRKIFETESSNCYTVDG